MAVLNFFGALNSFVPQATGQVIQFSRDPKKYRINEYAQLVPTKAPLFTYYRIGVDFDVRVENDEEWVWHDGGRRPNWKNNAPKFDAVMARTIRRNRGTEIGWETIENADCKVLVAATNGIQNQIMTARTNRLWNGPIGGFAPTGAPNSGGLENASNWGQNTGTANSLNGNSGFWDQGSDDRSSPNFLAIKKTLDTVASLINLLTNNAVNNVEDGLLMLILNPDAALRISETPEIHSYLARSPFAMAQVAGDKPGQNAKWGLPDMLYGWKIVVEPAAIVTQHPNAADAIGSEASIAGGSTAPRRYIKQYNSATVLSRIGGLDGTNGAQSFSTAQYFYKDKEMQLETFDEPKDRLTEVHAVEEVVPVLAASASGFQITSIFS